MPTPNWGPRAGQPMTDAEFSDYVAQNPTGLNVNGVYWGGRAPISDPTNPQVLVNDTPARSGLAYWQQFFNSPPNMGIELPSFDTANQAGARSWQQELMQGLQRQAAGDPDSVAQRQLASSFSDAKAGQGSLASTMRGQSAGAAMRAAQQGRDDLQRAMPGAQAMLMQQEQQGARAALAQLLAQMQTQDTANAQGVAQNALGGAELQRAMEEFYARQGLQTGIDLEQQARERALARLGISQGYENLGKDAAQRVAQAAAGFTSAAAEAAGGGGSGGKGRTTQEIIDDAFEG